MYKVVIDYNYVVLEHSNKLACGANRTGAVPPIIASEIKAIPSLAVRLAWEKVVGVSLAHHFRE